MKQLVVLLLLLLITSQLSAQNAGQPTLVKCKHQEHHTSHFGFGRYERPEWYDDYNVTFYFLDINVENNTTFVSGNATTIADVKRLSLEEFKFELLAQLTIDSVIVNGVNSSFTRLDDEVTVALQNNLTLGETLSFTVYYNGQAPSGGFFSGISTAYIQSWGKNVTWTLSEPFNAKQWWPCKQDLYDKADSVYVFATTSDINKVGSNGLLTAVTSMPGNKARYEWKSYYPIAYYLISISVSDYQEYNIYAKPTELPGDSILIQNFIYNSPGCLNYYKEGIDRTSSFIELLSEYYGMYPFKDEKYGHCLAGIGGGMEHQTMTTIGGFSFGLVAHELGHMWFGDNVTCATWSDIWINEGFASYTEYLTAYYIQGPSSGASWMNGAHNSIKSSPGGSVYVPPDEVNPGNVWRIFDGRLSYKKGAAIIHVLRQEIQNDELFFEILQEFQDQYRDSVATGVDFVNVANQLSGQHFGYFLEQWYFGEGYPIYDVIWNQSADKLYITTTQTASTNVTTLFETYVEYKVNYTDATNEIILLRQTENVNNYEIPISKPVASIELDPDNWLIKDVDGIMVGISNHDSPVHFSLAPNPSSDKMNLYFDQQNISPKEVLITDLTGKAILKTTAGDPIFTIDVSGFAPGVYLVTVFDGQHRLTQRLIRK
ncbi:MAG: T9SS type A sorting domain-containing protein [Bacteroidales bacterium]|nr:T9SS type A sorting domain-containing protein [Bacteroidales bacterium]